MSGSQRFTSESSEMRDRSICEHCLKPAGTTLDQQEQNMEQ